VFSLDPKHPKLPGKTKDNTASPALGRDRFGAAAESDRTGRRLAAQSVTAEWEGRTAGAQGNGCALLVYDPRAEELARILPPPSRPGLASAAGQHRLARLGASPCSLRRSQRCAAKSDNRASALWPRPLASPSASPRGLTARLTAESTCRDARFRASPSGARPLGPAGPWCPRGFSGSKRPLPAGADSVQASSSASSRSSIQKRMTSSLGKR
jgi:hypothetical protein